MRHYVGYVVCLALSVVALPERVAACDFPDPLKLRVEANPSDQAEPSAPTAAVDQVQRGDDWTEDSGCGQVATSSCDGTAFVVLQVSSSDDTTEESALGYTFESTNERLHLPKEPIVAGADGKLSLFFSDDEERDFRATIRVFAVDEAGNVSGPTTVVVKDEGSGSCQLARSPLAGLTWSGVMLLTLLMRQRRRERV